MKPIVKAAVNLAAGGLILALSEALLSKKEIGTTARIAIGLLYLELLAQQIIGIIP